MLDSANGEGRRGGHACCANAAPVCPPSPTTGVGDAGLRAASVSMAPGSGYQVSGTHALRSQDRELRAADRQLAEILDELAVFAGDLALVSIEGVQAALVDVALDFRQGRVPVFHVDQAVP